jgi:hypothetical protein
MNLLDRRVSELKSERPSANNLVELTSISRYELTPEGRVELLATLEKHASWLNSHIHEVTYLISLDQPGAQSDGAFQGYGSTGSAITSELNDQEREEIAAALRISPNTAQRRIDTATLLVHHLPETTRALADGTISTAHANTIARESAPLIYGGADKSIIAKIESKALASAEFATPNQIAVSIRKAVAEASPAELEERFASARDQRRVICYPENNGMATISALLTAPDARLVMRSIERRLIDIDKSDKDQMRAAKSADQRRADAFVQLITGGEVVALAGQKSAGAGTRRRDTSRAMTINVIVDLPTLLGLADNPAELSGYGPIPASLARELAASHQWRRFISDPVTGELLDVGRGKYQPPEGLIDFINARDRTCRFPGCRRAAELGDIDHAIPWDQGGSTTPNNLGALCRRHHRLKTHGGWKIVSNADGSCSWTSPYGRKYFVPSRPIHEVA